MLGPLLFYIYIDDISTISFSEGSAFNLFADDMLLFKVIKSPEDLNQLPSDNNKVHEWVSPTI